MELNSAENLLAYLQLYSAFFHLFTSLHQNPVFTIIVKHFRETGDILSFFQRQLGSRQRNVSTNCPKVHSEPLSEAETKFRDLTRGENKAQNLTLKKNAELLQRDIGKDPPVSPMEEGKGSQGFCCQIRRYKRFVLPCSGTVLYLYQMWVGKGLFPRLQQVIRISIQCECPHTTHSQCLHSK